MSIIVSRNMFIVNFMICNYIKIIITTITELNKNLIDCAIISGFLTNGIRKCNSFPKLINDRYFAHYLQLELMEFCGFFLGTNIVCIEFLKYALYLHVHIYRNSF